MTMINGEDHPQDENDYHVQQEQDLLTRREMILCWVIFAMLTSGAVGLSVILPILTGK